MTTKAAAIEVAPFRPRSGVTIHTTDEEAKQAEMQAGSKDTHSILEITVLLVSILGLLSFTVKITVKITELFLSVRFPILLDYLVRLLIFQIDY